MHDQSKLFTVGMATVVLSSLLLTLGCSNSTSSASTSGAEPTAVLGAAGSTFVAPLMTKWVSVYQQTPLRYKSTIDQSAAEGALRSSRKAISVLVRAMHR